MLKNNAPVTKKDILEVVKDEEYLELIVKKITEHNHNFYASPLPKADELKYLEEKYPGITKVIMDFAQEIHKNNDANEKETLRIIEKDIDASKEIAKKGQNIVIGFLSGMFLFAGFLLFKEQYTLGVTLLSATAAASIVSAVMNKNTHEPTQSISPSE